MNHHNGLSADSSAVCKPANPQVALVNKLGGDSLECKLTFRDRKWGWCLILAYFLSNLQKQNPAKQYPLSQKLAQARVCLFQNTFLRQGTLPTPQLSGIVCSESIREGQSWIPNRCRALSFQNWSLWLEMHNNSHLLCSCCSKLHHK